MGKKGKAQGRAGQKKKAQKASHHTPPWTQDFTRGKNSLLYDSEDDDFPRTGFKGFTGASPRTPQSMDPNIKLRHRSIAFVSAGTNTPAEREEPAPERPSSEVEDNGEIDEDIDDDDDIQTNILLDVTTTQDAMGNMGIDSPPRPGNSQPLFVVDTVGDENLAGANKPEIKYKMPSTTVERAASPTPSDSSEEIVFAGRGNPPHPKVASHSMTETISPAASSWDAARKTASHPPVKQSKGPGTSQGSTQTPTQPIPRAWVTKTEDPVTNAAHPSNGWGSSHDAVSAEPLLKWKAYKEQQRARNQASSTTPDVWVPAPAVPYWKTGGQYNGVSHTPATEQGTGRSTGDAKGKINANASAYATANTDATANANARFGLDGAADSSVEGDSQANDTIEQLRADWRDALSIKKKERSKASEGGSRRGKRGRKKSNRLLRGGDNIIDSDEGLSEAAYDDYMANLAAHMDADDIGGLTKSEFVSGASMMVDGKEYGVDEVLDHKTHRHESQDPGVSEDRDDAMDTSDEDKKKQIGLDFDGGSDDEDSEWASEGSSELEDDLEYTERQQWEDEADLRQRHLDAKTDEQLAKLWAKQAELGLDDDELVIDDGEYDSGQYGDLVAARAGLGAVGFTGPKRKGKGKSNGFTFPNASALADAVDQYGQGGFDIMDFDRPSLRPVKKGRKGKLPPEIDEMSSEDGFKDDLADQWDRDRHKKKLKKLEREELRAQGLLGSAGKKGLPDLSQKYRDGMTLTQMKEELRTFIDSENETRAFPPMAKKDRKQLHEIVSALGINSKSIGGGRSRFPVLSKTRATNYDDDAFERVFGAASRGRVGFMGAKARDRFAAGKPTRGGKGGGFDTSSATVRNGEVVGAGAPEIAATSFGHKMMEKMGWSKGTALGKDGEGRLMPVEQVMRSGKAGLG